VFVFVVILCTHVVNHEKRISALNLNIRGKDTVELRVKGWRCGRSSGADGR
jgi:hypothetical protein